ncbi:hypothetical protein HMPREF9120_00960, partial [Neisseria sp. oral taxon 020 str. F0370]
GAHGGGGEGIAVFGSGGTVASLYAYGFELPAGYGTLLRAAFLRFGSRHGKGRQQRGGRTKKNFGVHGFALCCVNQGKE